MSDHSPYYRFATHTLTVGGLRVPLVLLFAAAGFLLLFTVALIKKLRPWQASLRGRPILTANEREFFYRLTRALPHHHIFPQVSFSAIIGIDSRLPGREQFAIRQRFNRKYADFVICEPHTLEILAIVELDDRTHDPDADQRRDVMTKAAGYQTFRFQSKAKPSIAELAELFS